MLSSLLNQIEAVTGNERPGLVGNLSLIADHGHEIPAQWPKPAE